MSRISPITAVSFGLLLALIAVFAFTTSRASAAPISSPSDLRVALACSPLTTDQYAKDGDPQTCRTRISHYGTSYTRNGVVIQPADIMNLQWSHPTPNNLVSISAVKSGPSGTVQLPCDQSSLTCDLGGALKKGERIIITEQLVFDRGQDGFPRTSATVTGVQNCVQLTATALENRSLP